jgi:hypothetical protein
VESARLIIAGSQAATAQSEVGMVEDVEEFRPEPQLEQTNSYGLADRQEVVRVSILAGSFRSARFLRRV